MKRENRCENCVHFVDGYYKTTQKEPVKVCALKPKRTLCDKIPKRIYYKRVYPNGHCDNFDSPPKNIVKYEKNN